MTLTTTQAAERTWPPDLRTPLDAALAYQRARLCVIPLAGKRPALKSWKPYQTERSTLDDIQRWHRENLLSNLGVVCGPVSDNLVVLDFDGPGAYGAFAALFPPLANSFTVATGSGQGKHVYLYVDQLPPTTRALDTPIGHIELRAEGTYVAAPPSVHPVTKQPYIIEKNLDILRVDDVDKLVEWIEAFKGASPAVQKSTNRSWRPPRVSPPGEVEVNPNVIQAIATRLRAGRFKERGEWINCSCPNQSQHSNGDRHPSFGFNTTSGYGFCYRCGSMLAKDLCELLGIDPAMNGGLVRKSSSSVVSQRRSEIASSSSSPPEPPEEDPPPISQLDLPTWLRAYLEWASALGNQTPETFHLGVGVWMAAVAIARRACTDARWGVRVFPNVYMMLVADTTFYRKTTAYKLGERVLNAAIPHLQMPTPGSPERFQDALAGQAPGNFSQLPQEQQKLVLEGQKFAAQRGLFKDEIAGLFGAFKRDYMSGLKDFILEIYDCPDMLAKETQSGLAVIRHAAPSILGVTTPAGLSGVISQADFDNGLLPRFALLTPEPDYRERPGLKEAIDPPAAVTEGLKALYQSLPLPEQSTSGWETPPPLRMEVEDWEAVEAYSSRLRRQCDPRLDTPLDDRLKGIYGRLHVQALKVALICAALDRVEAGEDDTPLITRRHWDTGQAVAESWRLSARRLLDGLDRGGAARQEFRIQDRVLSAVQAAGPGGVTLHSVYKNHNLQASAARAVARDLVQAGQIVETRIGRAEAYLAAQYVGD